MQQAHFPLRRPRTAVALGLVAVIGACGGASGPDGASGPAVGARAQTIGFAPAPTLALGGSATVSARASSALPVRYGSATPAVCTVDAARGEVRALTPGTCTVAATQDGDATWAAAPRATLALPVQTDPRQHISFGPAPALGVGGTATVSASASSGLPVGYRSLTPAVCGVDEASGRVTALAAGDCTIAANQPGNAHYQAAAQATQTLTVTAASNVQPPAMPQHVRASAGAQSGTVQVSAAQVDAGGSAITQFTVISSPPGITAQSATLPVPVACPGSCAGYAFALQASNAAGNGPVSALASIITDYNVVVRFKEPDYQHDMTEFHGSFTYNATTKTVSALQGEVSQVMAGNNQPGQPYPDGMPLLPLKHQLSSIPAPAGDGLLVTSFMLPTTQTLSADTRDGGSDGFSPGTGGWKYWGYNGGTRGAPNPGNAYVRIFVNTADPTRAPTPAQIDTLAYADCAPQGMMGDDCMTGTTVAGYGTIGSMRGYPVQQVVTRR